MKYNAFIEQVQKRAHLASQSEAQRASLATLETLAAYLSPKERHDAASQLPIKESKRTCSRRFSVLGSSQPQALKQRFP